MRAVDAGSSRPPLDALNHPDFQKPARKVPAIAIHALAIVHWLTMSGWFTLFTNCRYILNGELVEDHLVVSDETGLILKRDGYIGGEAVDLEDAIIAPGFLELHTNGANGFHFTHFDDEKSYAAKVDNIARYYATQGVTGFYATIPTVKSDEFQKVRTLLLHSLCEIT
jgi:N-acetylglucosamine-6-phosphate deacetylase